jgi:hypothetical protein
MSMQNLAPHQNPTPPAAHVRFRRAQTLGVQRKGQPSFAKSLAPFQSPTFRAVTIAPSPVPQKVMRIKLRIFEHDGRKIENGMGARYLICRPQTGSRNHG